MNPRTISVLILFFCLLLTVGGCSPPLRKRILWPVFPATPRMEWLGNYASQDDFPKTGRQIFSEAIIGKPEPATFKSPFGIVSDSTGVVYVADTYDGNLRVYDMVAKKVDDYSKDPLFGRPAGLAVDAADNLYVVDTEMGAVLVFDKDRRPLRTIGAPQELLAPVYIAIDEARARIYVSDPRANKIVIYDRFGKKAGEIGQQRTGESGGYIFSSPQGMAIDKEGNLYVAELLGAKISVFDAKGNYLRSFGERGDAVYHFEAPKDLAFDSDGNLWVVDARRSQIYTYSPAGVLLLATGSAAPSRDPLGFNSPTAIFIAANDTIYVTDQINRRFSVWRYFSDRYLQEHPFTAEEEGYLEEVGRRITVPPPPSPPLPSLPGTGRGAPLTP